MSVEIHLPIRQNWNHEKLKLSFPVRQVRAKLNSDCRQKDLSRASGQAALWVLMTWHCNVLAFVLLLHKHININKFVWDIIFCGMSPCSIYLDQSQEDSLVNNLYWKAKLYHKELCRLNSLFDMSSHLDWYIPSAKHQRPSYLRLHIQTCACLLMYPHRPL